MRQENEARLKKIKRISDVVRGACTGFLVLIVLGFLAAAGALVIGRGGTISYFGVGFRVDELTPGGRLGLVVMCVVASGIMVKCVYHLRRLMENYSRGEIFTRDSAAQIRQLGISCALWGGVKIVWGFLPMVLSAHPPKSFAANGDLVAIGLVVVVISWFMEMAAELREENELTV